MELVDFQEIDKLPFRPKQTSPTCNFKGMVVLNRRYFQLVYAGFIKYYIMVETRDTKTPMFKVIKILSLYNAEGQYVGEFTKRWNWIRSLIERQINEMLADRFEIIIYLPKDD